MTWKLHERNGPIRCGIAGYGKMGAHHAREFIGKSKDFHLVSAYDPVEERRKAAAEETGVRTWSTFEELLQDTEVDLVVIATPSDSHGELSIKALKAGKHVLCEKPMCTEVTEAEKMLEAALENERLLYIAQNRRWDDYFLTVKRVVDSGRLGKILQIKLIWWTWSDALKTFGVKAFRTQWRSEARYGGGMIYDWGSHYLDQLLLLVPSNVEKVFGHVCSYHWCEDTDDQYTGMIFFSDGTVCHIENSLSSKVPLNTGWVINGSEMGYKDGKLYADSKEETAEKVEQISSEWDAMYKDLAEALLTGKTPYVRPEQTVEVIRLINALQVSSREGRVVHMEEMKGKRR